MVYIKPVNPYGKWDRQAKKFFNTEKERKSWMKENKMIDSPPTGSEKRRVRDAIDEINADRVKRGQKELSSERIVGDSKGAKYVRKYF